MPPVRKYQGKRPSKASFLPVRTQEDSFDRLFGRPRSPHPFSSSSEALQTPSPALPEEPPSTERTPLFFSHAFMDAVDRAIQERQKKRLLSKSITKPLKKTHRLKELDLIFKDIPKGCSTPLAKVHSKKSITKTSPSLDSITRRLGGLGLAEQEEHESFVYVTRRRVRVDSVHEDSSCVANVRDTSKEQSGVKEVSGSGVSSDDFYSADSIPSSPERAPSRTTDRSNFRRSPYESLLSPRNSLREELMSSSEDENDEDNFADKMSRPSDVPLCPLYERSVLEPLHENVETDDDDENSSLSSESSKKSPVDSLDSNRTPNMRRKASRHSEERSPTGRLSISGRASITPELLSVMEEPLEHFVLKPGKNYRRSLLIIKTGGEMEESVQKGRQYNQTVEEVLKLQTSHNESMAETPIQLIRKRISLRRTSYLKQITPPPRRRRTFLPKICNQTSVSPTADRDHVLKICGQTTIPQMSDVLTPEALKGCSKIGEGVYGEVFMLKRKATDTVLKIMPIEGSKKVNGAVQRTFGEITPELIVSKSLHELREAGENTTNGYAEIVSIKVVEGAYPQELLESWDKFDQLPEGKGSENDRPDSNLLPENQLFVLIEQSHAGAPLDGYRFCTANAAFSVFKQVAFSLAVAEAAIQFEHRDLHLGNVLINRTTEKMIKFKLNSTEYKVAAVGVKATIIDFTLSRFTSPEGPWFNDLAKDPELFLGTGDIQFDVYRRMKTDVSNDWSVFEPKTNVRWLQYLVKKFLIDDQYSRRAAKVHVDRIKDLKKIDSWIESCGSAVEVAERLNENK